MIQNSIEEKQKTLSIKRTLNLPLNTVWKAWTEPESFKKWWGPKEYTCPDCTIDFKIGGKFLASMQGEDGKKIWSTGTYKEIIPQKKIVVTDSFADSTGNIVPASYYKMPGEWALELMVTVEFEEVDGKTNLKLQHAGLPPEMTDDCMKGWQSSFDKLESNIK
ncbi:MAG TPA: SRPBCC domain-containing protein [Bacteroidia bacterium]|nr:SRPBCC domain-containing protein [Bacteroidia bacterium]